MQPRQIVGIGWIGLILAMSPILEPGTLLAQSYCPLKPAGVTVETNSGGDVFYSTATALPLSADDGGLKEAQEQARIAARVALAEDKRLLRGSDGKLQGAKDEGVCSANGLVFATVSIGPASSRKAQDLKESIQRSLARTPSPKINSYFWQDGHSNRAPDDMLNAPNK